MLPALRITNSCPCSCCVTNSGTVRLSEQEINSAFKFWLEAGLRVPYAGKFSFWKLRKPSMICCARALCICSLRNIIILSPWW